MHGIAGLKTAISAWARESTCNLNNTLSIYRAIGAVQTGLLLDFETQLRSRCLYENYHLEWDMNHEYWPSVSIKRAPDQAYFVAYQSPSGLNKWHWGVSKARENLPSQPEIARALEESTFGPGLNDKDRWWVWKQFVDGPNANWSANVDPWIGISDGSLADEWVKMAKDVYAIVGDKISEAAT